VFSPAGAPCAPLVGLNRSGLRSHSKVSSRPIGNVGMRVGNHHTTNALLSLPKRGGHSPDICRLSCRRVSVPPALFASLRQSAWPASVLLFFVALHSRSAPGSFVLSLFCSTTNWRFQAFVGFCSTTQTRAASSSAVVLQSIVIGFLTIGEVRLNGQKPGVCYVPAMSS
jgi:hypothetical protein